MTAGDQNASPVVRYHLMLSDPFSETIDDARPRPTGFVSVPSAAARDVNEMWAENASESRVHVQRMTEGWLMTQKVPLYS